jgi:hypothetical protein
MKSIKKVYYYYCLNCDNAWNEIFDKKVESRCIYCNNKYEAEDAMDITNNQEVKNENKKD